MICHGLAASSGSFIFGNLVKWTGRIPIVLFGAAINLSLISAMLFFWHPDPNHPEMFYIVVALWGLGNAVWNTQLNCKIHFLAIIQWFKMIQFKFQHFMELFSRIEKRRDFQIFDCGSLSDSA